MQVEWYGQSAFRLAAPGATVFIDPFGEVTAIASEHDQAAGTERGPNTIFAFDLDDVRIAHFGDFGQRSLRPEQADDFLDLPDAFLERMPHVHRAGSPAFETDLLPVANGPLVILPGTP